MATSKTIIVLGAGALGSMVAYMAARAGHRVSVHDPAPLGANASGVAAGMLAPACEALLDPASAGHFALLREARDLWPSIAAGLDLPLDRAGAMAIGGRAEAEAWADGLRTLGADVAVIGAPGRRWGALTGADWRLDPIAALTALHRAAQAMGVTFDADARPRLEAEAVVFATGADPGGERLVPEIAHLSPIKGHILRAAGNFGGGPVLRVPGAYLCRTPDGAVLGATMESGRTDLGVDPAVVARLLADARPLTTRLGDVAWRAQTGLRAATPDALPLVGRSRSAAGNYFLAVGARRNGWLLAPMIAATVLDALEGRGSGTAALFDPARFGGASPC